MIRVSSVRLDIDRSEKELKGAAAKLLRINEREILSLRILKKSLDARKKNSIHWLYTLCLETKNEDKLIRSGKASKYVPFSYSIPHTRSESRPVVVGFGPGGMFAALVLAEAGLKPIVVERGDCAEERQRKVEHFWRTGELDESSNVQFGEGGAGMFSDGKLSTNTHDERIAWVLETLCRYGAPENICYDAKPHVGTDVLINVVKNIRLRIEELGGEVHHNTSLVSVEGENALKTAVIEHDGVEKKIPCSELILAIGHSARDTFEMINSLGISMERKPFSMGVRIEHKQSDVGQAQYGGAYKRLPSADYKLNCRLPDGGSAYTFCMCPGGYVVAAASEKGGVVTNGMSYSGRSGENANSALLVTLEPEDFPGEGVLAGMYWQRSIEQRAFAYGGGDYRAPAQTVGDFLNNRPSTGCNSVGPTYKPGVKFGDLREVLPEKITDTIAGAIPALAAKMSCFGDENAVMTAPETRSSSPVRIIRGENLQSVTMAGLYPCGEGAGYAGGITSAAVDGMKCAEAVIKRIGEREKCR